MCIEHLTALDWHMHAISAGICSVESPLSSDDFFLYFVCSHSFNRITTTKVEELQLLNHTKMWQVQSFGECELSCEDFFFFRKCYFCCSCYWLDAVDDNNDDDEGVVYGPE